MRFTAQNKILMEEEKIEPALYLIPSPIGDTPSENVLPAYNAAIVRNIRHFIVESRKSAVRFLSRIITDFNAEDYDFTELSEHTDEKADLSKILLPLEKGEPMGVISDAGCPAVGDPGSRAVEIAHKKNLKVIPLVGPNSIIPSLMSSGFNGQNFAFNGYLPIKNGEREGKIKMLESRAYKENQTQIFIVAPYRNQKLFEAILKTCRGETRLCLAQGITTKDEFIKTMRISDWKKSPPKELGKIPMIFLLYK